MFKFVDQPVVVIIVDGCSADIFVGLESFVSHGVSRRSISVGFFRARLLLQTERIAQGETGWLVIFPLAVRRVHTFRFSLVLEHLFHEKAPFLKLLPVIQVSLALFAWDWSAPSSHLCCFILNNLLRLVLGLLLDNDDFWDFDRGGWGNIKSVTVFLGLVVFAEKST